MRKLINKIRGRKTINLNELPSQNLFYPDDFSIMLKKATNDDIKDFNRLYNKASFVVSMTLVKTIVAKNLILPDNYTPEDIVNCDVLYLFLELVKHTRGMPVNIMFDMDGKGKMEMIPFDHKHFNYFKVPSDLMDKYDIKSKRFIINNVKYRIPDIYIQNRILNFLCSESKENDPDYYNNADYNFIYFIDDKMETDKDVENMIWLYNDGMEDAQVKEIDKVVKKLSGFSTYSLVSDNNKMVN
jgi:hypothetical protein